MPNQPYSYTIERRVARLCHLARMLSRLVKSARSEHLTPFERDRLANALFHLERDVKDTLSWL